MMLALSVSLALAADCTASLWSPNGWVGWPATYVDVQPVVLLSGACEGAALDMTVTFADGTVIATAEVDAVDGVAMLPIAEPLLPETDYLFLIEGTAVLFTMFDPIAFRTGTERAPAPWLPTLERVSEPRDMDGNLLEEIEISGPEEALGEIGTLDDAGAFVHVAWGTPGDRVVVPVDEDAGELCLVARGLGQSGSWSAIGPEQCFPVPSPVKDYTLHHCGTPNEGMPGWLALLGLVTVLRRRRSGAL